MVIYHLLTQACYQQAIIEKGNLSSPTSDIACLVLAWEIHTHTPSVCYGNKQYYTVCTMCAKEEQYIYPPSYAAYKAAANGMIYYYSSGKKRKEELAGTKNSQQHWNTDVQQVVRLGSLAFVRGQTGYLGIC